MEEDKDSAEFYNSESGWYIWVIPAFLLVAAFGLGYVILGVLL